MNKTVNINLANMLFHIDEKAYQKLLRYLEAIKRSFAGTKGSDEIIADVEARIAELFYEKMENERQVITLKEVDEVITVMGQPEDYMVDEDIFEDGPTTGSGTTSTRSRSKKLYRDIDHKYIGGVCSGLEHYLGIDAIWIRIIFIILAIFGSGFGLIAYILLWILVPEAVTTAQKLDMKGEPVNLSNIEKKVKEGFDDVAEKVRNVDYDKMGDRVKSGGKSFFDTLGDIILFLFKVFGKFIGVLLIIVGISALIALLITLFSIGVVDGIRLPGVDLSDLINITDTPIWLISILTFFALGIPFFFLFYLGLKILVKNLKSIGNIAKFSLLGLWLLAVISLSVLGIQQASARAFTGTVSETQTLESTTALDTLYLTFRESEFSDYDNAIINGMEIRYDENDNPVIYGEDIYFDIRRTQDSVPSLKIRKDADGSSFKEARDKAAEIRYAYALSGNTLALDNFYLTDVANKVRDQEMRITLYVPAGTVIIPDGSGRDRIGRSTRFDRDIYRKEMVEYRWQMSEDGVLKCLNCPEEMEKSQEDGEGHIIINEEGIDIDLRDETDSFKMNIDENGVRINAGDDND